MISPHLVIRKLQNTQHTHVIVLTVVIITTLQIEATQQDTFHLDYS